MSSENDSDESIDSDFQEFQCGWCDDSWFGKVMWPCEICREKACQSCQDKYFRHIGCAFESDYACPECLPGLEVNVHYCLDKNCDCGNTPPEREAKLKQRRAGRTPLTFGKYRGKYLVDLIKDKNTSNYVSWLASLKTKLHLLDWEQKVFQTHLNFVEEAIGLLSTRTEADFSSINVS